MFYNEPLDLFIERCDFYGDDAATVMTKYMEMEKRDRLKQGGTEESFSQSPLYMYKYICIFICVGIVYSKTVCACVCKCFGGEGHAMK